MSIIVLAAYFAYDFKILQIMQSEALLVTYTAPVDTEIFLEPNLKYKISHVVKI